MKEVIRFISYCFIYLIFVVIALWLLGLGFGGTILLVPLSLLWIAFSVYLALNTHPAINALLVTFFWMSLASVYARFNPDFSLRHPFAYDEYRDALSPWCIHLACSFLVSLRHDLFPREEKQICKDHPNDLNHEV